MKSQRLNTSKTATTSFYTPLFAHSLKALNNKNTFSNVTSPKKKSILKKAEVSTADFRCDSKVSCLASERLKKKQTLFNIKIKNKIYCQQLLLETAQLSQLGLAIPLSGHI